LASLFFLYPSVPSSGFGFEDPAFHFASHPRIRSCRRRCSGRTRAVKPFVPLFCKGLSKPPASGSDLFPSLYGDYMPRGSQRAPSKNTRWGLCLPPGPSRAHDSSSVCAAVRAAEVKGGCFLFYASWWLTCISGGRSCLDADGLPCLRAVLGLAKDVAINTLIPGPA
jgi:hypothetical protein